MRVTQTMLSNNMLRHLFDSQAKMDKYLTQTYTGKKIRRPSENPVIAMQGIGYRTQVKEVEQYKRNTAEVWNWLDNTDESLDKATKVMQRLEYLAVQAANDTYSEDERKSIQTEVKQLKEQMIEIANTNVNGKYIFNGTDTDTPRLMKDPLKDEDGNYVIVDEEGKLVRVDPEGEPVDQEIIVVGVGKRIYTNINLEDLEIEEIDGTEWKDLEKIHGVKIEVSKGISIDVNLNPVGVFDNDLMASIDDFISALGGEGDFNDSIAALNKGSQNIINARAEVGAKMNRMELIEHRLEEHEAIAKEMMSNNENIDFEEAITNLITQETLHRAALAAGSRIIQPSLLDFLR